MGRFRVVWFCLMVAAWVLPGARGGQVAAATQSPFAGNASRGIFIQVEGSGQSPLVVAESHLASCITKSEFISDVTVPDGSMFAPEVPIDKTWRLRNSGTCPWEADYRLGLIRGDPMGAPPSVRVGQPVAPGETVDVTVAMIAPPQTGVATGWWQMMDSTGESFGDVVTIEVNVSKASPDTVAPAS